MLWLCGFDCYWVFVWIRLLVGVVFLWIRLPVGVVCVCGLDG